MIENNKIVINYSKAKLFRALIYCIFFLLIGIWMIISNPQTSNPIFNNPIIKTIASYGSTFLGLLGICFFTMRLMSKKPALILSEEGIIVNTSAFNFGLVPWYDISDINERSVQASVFTKQRFVTIGFKDLEKYIAKETNLMKRKLLIANSNNNGSPFHISTNALAINHENLLKLVTENFEMYKNLS